ncbi:hypothetical protein [Nocardia sp. NPDC004604]|uniref:hypothetical protein n=1 Tax=Nocardia sp. NPDC004604 TaxID=3157013 RepID=UPI0033B219C1
MNAIVIASVVLVVIVIAAVVTRRLRQRTEHTHLTVADLQARLAEEAERLLSDSPVAESDTEHATPHFPRPQRIGTGR